MNRFRRKEFLDLCRSLSVKPCIREIALEYADSKFFNTMKKYIETDRRGEVVFCVIRPNGKVISITCNEYPAGVYRIPTGGIGYDEDVIAAAHREVKEELGLEAVIFSFAGVLKTRFVHAREKVMFYSYIFIMKETGGRLLVDAADDEISEVREVDLDGLQAIVDNLADIPGERRDWGRFRHETSKAVLNHLRNGYGL